MDKLLKRGFQEIGEKDILDLSMYYERMERPYASSIALLSIYAWKDNLPAYYQVMEKHLWFMVFDRENDRWVSLPLIGDYEKEAVKKALYRIEEIVEKMEIPLVFTDVTPWMLPYYEEVFQNRMETIDDTHLQEYIYQVEQFLEKQDQQRERYNYHYFLTKNEVRTVEADASDEEDCQNLLKASFCNFHHCDECEYGCLKDTLHRALQIKGKNIHNILVYANGKPVAYSFVSQENGDLVFHFKKNLRGYRGINEYLHRECIERFGIGMERINYTEDMGVEGLRTYKQNLCAYGLQPKLELRIGERIKNDVEQK